MDRGQKETERILKDLEKKINREYAIATKEIEEKLTDYFKRFETKDKIWQGWVEDGKKTEEEYKKWRMGQFAVGERWKEQKNEIARDMVNAGEVARAMSQGAAADVYAHNHNYATYELEKDAKIDTGYTLYSKSSVARLMIDDPEVLPPPGKKVSKAIAEGRP